MAKFRGRGPYFNADMDPALLASVEQAARSFAGPYEIQLASGYRPGDPRFHGKRSALDVALFDPTTGAKIDWYQKGGQPVPYQQFANHWYQSLTPEQQKLARWGGYFGNPDDPSYGTKYGDQDYMHFDFGRSPTTGMLAGDWNTGFNPAAMKRLGLTDAGGLGGVAQAMASAGYSPEQIKAAFLSTIAGTESPGYDVLYGGGKFYDYSQHPDVNVPITSGPNVGKTSSAAGRYQIIKPTWDAAQKALGLTDFGEKSQDAAAWWIADEAFKKSTGGSLMDALSSNDPGRINAAAKILSSQWTSLPGGIEQSKGYGAKTFADAFRGSLASAGASGGTSVPSTPAASVGPPVAAAGGKKPTALEAMAKAGMEAGGRGVDWPMPQLPSQPPAARVDAPAVAVVDPAQAENRRNSLAMILARLNQGTLV